MVFSTQRLCKSLLEPSHIFFVLLLCLPLFSFASEKPQLDSSTLEKFKFDIHPDFWIQTKAYLAKGSLYKISDACKKNESFLVYDNNSLKGEPLLKINSPLSIFMKGKKCELSEINRIYSTKFRTCRNDFCSNVEESDQTREVDSLLKMKVSLLDLEKDSSCSLKINLVNGYREDENEPWFYYFGYRNVSPDMKYVEIDINGKPGFLDLTGCKNTSDVTNKEAVNIPKSKYEEDLDYLKKIQVTKNFPQLDRAIKLVLPCVEKGDQKCVQAQLAKRDYEFKEFVPTKVDAEIMKELKQCLSYSSLLPHLKASKGIKKVCIFNSEREKEPLKSVSYPEALSSSSPILIPEE